jgi:type I restriction enzyme M protein
VNVENWGEKVSFIWSVKETLRDRYKRHEYGQVILPMAVICRLDSVLAPTKDTVLARAGMLPGQLDDHEAILCHASGQQFYNNLRSYLDGFSPNTRDIIEHFDFYRHIERMDRGGVLYPVIKRFTEIDLHPERVTNHEMGYIYEELIRVVADLSNEEAGEHFTPREVIRLMVNLVLADDRDLNTPGKVITVYDPTAGTGGMLTEAEQRITTINPGARVHLFGQEVADESYAICRSDLMLKGQGVGNVAFGSTLTQDGFPDRKFSYQLANRLSVRTGRRSSSRSTGSGAPPASGAGSHQACRPSPTGSCCSCCTWSTRFARSPRAAAASPSSPTAPRCSAATPGPARVRSAGSCSRTTTSKPSSACPTRCSTTPASTPTYGC